MKILVSSLAKSGTNYISAILKDLGYKESSSGFSYQSIINKGYLIRYFLRGGWISKSPLLLGYDFKVPFSPKWIAGKLGKINQGEYVTSHCNYSDQMYSIIESCGVSVVKIVRHPLDVMVSYKEYVENNTENPLHKYFVAITEAERWEIMMYGGYLGPYYLSSQRERLLSVNEWFKFDRAVILRFETLKRLSSGGKGDVDELQPLLDVLGVTEYEFYQSVKRCYGKSHTFNRGEVNRYLEEVPVVIRNDFKRLCGDIVEEWGYHV